MGLSYLAFAGSLAALQNVYGSRDEELLAKLVRGTRTEPRHYLRLKGGAEDPLSPVSDEQLAPLHEILIGTALENEPAHKYAYALVASLYEVTEPLGHIDTGHGRLFDADELLRQNGINDVLPTFDSEWPLEVPLLVKDWPMFALVPCAVVGTRAAQLRRYLLGVQRDASDEQYLVCEFVEQFADWYERCEKTKNDLLLVEH